MSHWVSGDHHLDHRAIIKYEDRVTRVPVLDLDSIDEMNDKLINLWNTFVGKDDKVWYLGDFALTSRLKRKELCSKMNGQKIIILGNHDQGAKAMVEAGFIAAYRWLICEIGIEDRTLEALMIHDPAKRPEGYKPDLVLCGHVHSAWKRQNQYNEDQPLVVNVGVDVSGFEPVELDWLLAEIGEIPGTGSDGITGVPHRATLKIKHKPKSTGPKLAFKELEEFAK